MIKQFKPTGFPTLQALAACRSLGAAPVNQSKMMGFNIWEFGGRSLSKCVELIGIAGSERNIFRNEFFTASIISPQAPWNQTKPR